MRICQKDLNFYHILIVWWWWHFDSFSPHRTRGGICDQRAQRVTKTIYTSQIDLGKLLYDSSDIKFPKPLQHHRLLSFH